MSVLSTHQENSPHNRNGYIGDKFPLTMRISARAKLSELLGHTHWGSRLLVLLGEHSRENKKVKVQNIQVLRRLKLASKTNQIE